MALAFALFLLAPNAEATPVLVPPRPTETPTPWAPSGTRVAPVCLVDAALSSAGDVVSATAVLCDAGLTPDVLEAVRLWRFEPALRDGVPVAANVHLRVELRVHAPLAEPRVVPTESAVAPSLAAPPLATSGTAPALPEEVLEVNVRGSKPIAPHVQLLAAEIRELPGAFGDAFRAIEALPGVTPILSGIPYFVIRGAPPGNTGFFLDGVRVPSLFHFAVGEAVVHPGLIESVDLYSGAYPARFGRYAGGILSGDTVPEADRLRGEASVRLLDTGALVETPFDGGSGSALVSGRVGYPGLLLYVFDPSVGLQYYDYQARVSYRLHDGSELRVFGFGSYDSLSSSSGGGPLEQVLSIEFERLALRYTRHVGTTGELRVEATVGHDRTASGSSPPLTLSSATYSLAGDLVMHPSSNVTVRTGADVVYEPYRFDFVSNNSTPGDPTGGALLGAFLPTAQNDLTAGVYAELGAKLSPRVDGELGLRGDLFTATYPGQDALNPTTTARQVPAFDPRLTVRIKLIPGLRSITALGVAHQPSNIPLPIPALSFSQLGRGLQTAYQTSEGLEAQLPWDFTATVTGFLNDFSGLAQLTNNCPVNAPSSCAGTTVFGRSYGLEVFLRRTLTRRLSGWLSYTFSRSERDSFDGATGLSGHQLSEFDRPHVANLIVAYDLGAHWRAGARFVAYSGAPYATASIDGIPNARTPPFYRLDLRLEKKWPKKWGHISFVAEWLNVFLQKEQLGLTCEGASTSSCTPSAVGPITIPSLGFEGAYGVPAPAREEPAAL